MNRMFRLKSYVNGKFSEVIGWYSTRAQAIADIESRFGFDVSSIEETERDCFSIRVTNQSYEFTLKRD